MSRKLIEASALVLLLHSAAFPSRGWCDETQQLAVITDNLPVNAFSFGLDAKTDAAGSLTGFAFNGWFLEPDGFLSIKKTELHEEATMEQLQARGGLTVQDVVSVRAEPFPADAGGRITLQFETNIVASDPRSVALRVGRAEDGAWAVYYEHEGREVRVSRLHIAAAIEGTAIVGISRIILKDEDGRKLAELSVSDLPRASLPGAAPAVTPDPRSNENTGPAPAVPGQDAGAGEPAPLLPGGASPAR